jgi:flagellar protein FlgJ
VSSQPVGPGYYADFSGLESLKKSVKADDPAAIRAAAQQFESLFTSMMLKSMRDARVGQGLGDSQQSDLYQEMYDQQISLKISQGRGLGLADMLVQQLTRNRAAKASSETDAVTGTSSPAAPPTTRADFIRQMQPLAEKASAQLGVSADTLIGQAALETGWGQHLPAASGGASSSNLFGVKAGASWQGGVGSALTTEYDGNGQAASVSQPFRTYASVQAGVNDYVTLLQRSSRYSQALGTGDDVQAFGSALARGGYATDPNYVRKLAAVVSEVKAVRSSSETASLKNPGAAPTTATGET